MGVAMRNIGQHCLDVALLRFMTGDANATIQSGYRPFRAEESALPFEPDATGEEALLEITSKV